MLFPKWLGRTDFPQGYIQKQSTRQPFLPSIVPHLPAHQYTARNENPWPFLSLSARMCAAPASTLTPTTQLPPDTPTG
eukprot:m.377197 g.377197  ORF g.377197 m.377197 type:complete len:78 (+) comp20923_c0_seq87:4519-4752(+)